MSDENYQRKALVASIFKGERVREEISNGMVHLKGGKLLVTPDFDWQQSLRTLRTAAIAISAKGDRLVISPRLGPLKTHRLTRIGESIRTMCLIVIPLVKRNSAGFTLIGGYHRQEDLHGNMLGLPCQSVDVILHPYITVMLRACMGIVRKVDMADIHDFPSNPQPHVIRALEGAAKFTRFVCGRPEFKKQLDNYQRGARKNLKSCLDYVAHLFERHSKLLVIRVDLYVRPEHIEWSASPEAEKCMSRFMRALRDGRIIKPEVKGWVLRREAGVYRGIHHHLMVFLDGQKHSHGHTYSEQVGQAWVDKFSDGKGSYWNCWILRKEYMHNALGVVCLSDRDMLKGIWVALSYLTKADSTLITGFSRNLRRGIAVQFDDQSKLGAPRKEEDSLAVLKDVFYSRSSELGG